MLRITNNANQRDGQIDIQFPLPPGVRVNRISRRTNPELSQFQNNAGVISLAPVPSMNPGESIDYEIELSSNQPQDLRLNVQIRSLLLQTPIQVQAKVDVQ